MIKLSKNKVKTLEQEAIGNKCEKCGITNNLTYDHIIPKTILIDFNIDPARTFWKENSQTLCRRCNQWKGAKIDTTNPKTKKLFNNLFKNYENN